MVWVLLQFNHNLQPRLMSQPSDISKGGTLRRTENEKINLLKQQIHGSNTNLNVSKLTNCVRSTIAWFLLLHTKLNTNFYCAWRQMSKIYSLFSTWETKSLIFRLRRLYLEIWNNLFFNNGFSCLIKLSKDCAFEDNWTI